MPDAIYVDGRRGVVRVLDRNECGLFHFKDGHLVIKELRGRVTWIKIGDFRRGK